MNDFNNDYFCVLPFFGYEYYEEVGGSHCCLLPSGYNIDEIRQDMLDGKRSKWCTACWNIEDKGFQSDRLLKNAAMDFYADRDIRFIEQDVKQGKYSEVLVKISSSNLCNATCTTCNSASSSAWGALARHNGGEKTSYTKISESRLHNIDFPNLVTLNLLAGEPLLEPITFDILEKLLESGNTECFVSITTNGSIVLSKQKLDMLKKIKKLNINVSIDGIGPVSEYLRYPLSWKEVQENIAVFRTVADTVSVSYTISNLNVLYHHKTTEWFKDQNLDYILNPVIDPSYFRPSALVDSVKQRIFDKQGTTKDLDFFLNTNNSVQDELDFHRMIAEVKLQDSWKKINIKDYLPEFYNLIAEYY